MTQALTFSSPAGVQIVLANTSAALLNLEVYKVTATCPGRAFFDRENEASFVESKFKCINVSRFGRVNRNKNPTRGLLDINELDISKNISTKRKTHVLNVL